MNGTYSLPSAPPAREANRDIIFMMLPLLVVACYLYGGRPAVMCCVAVATAVVCDHLTAWMRGRTHDSAENSSIPMALVTTMMLPASVSYYIVVVAVAVGVVLGKECVRRLGRIPLQPLGTGLCCGCGKLAAAGISLPGALYTTHHCQHAERHTGGIARHGAARGRHAQPARAGPCAGKLRGAIGTTAVLVIIACALYLWVRRDITLSIPAGFFLAVVCVAFFFPRVGQCGLCLALAGSVPALPVCKI